MSSFNSISADKLWRLVGVSHGPALIDVRSKDAFAADPRFVPGAMRRPHETASSWAREFAGRATVAICENGGGQSEGVAAWLRGCGATSAEVLAGGHEAWTQAGLPLVPEGKLPRRDPQGRTVWVTRSRPKIDRIACPWLVRRFVDPGAMFLFVAPAEVQSVAERFNGAPFDIEGVFWNHRGERCTFDTILDELGFKHRRSRSSRGSSGRQTPTGLIVRLKRQVFSPPRWVCPACILTISSNWPRAWRSTTPSTAGRATPATRRTIGRRTPRRNKDDRLTSDQNQLKPF